MFKLQNKKSRRFMLGIGSLTVAYLAISKATQTTEQDKEAEAQQPHIAVGLAALIMDDVGDCSISIEQPIKARTPQTIPSSQF